MSKLVYWYGTAYDLRKGFSYISKKNFITWEEGKKKGLDQVPLKVLKKRITGDKLTKNETLLYDGLKEQLKDSKLPKEKRSPWLFKFKEDHDEDNHDDSMDESDDESDEDNTIDEIGEGDTFDEAGENDSNDETKKAEKEEVEEEKSSSTPRHVDEGIEVLSAPSSLRTVEQAEELYLSSFMV